MMGNANGGLNMEQVDKVMAAGFGDELATAVVNALQALPVQEGADTESNENIVAGLTEVFEKAQKSFTGLNLGGQERNDLTTGVAELVNIAKNMIQDIPSVDEPKNDDIDSETAKEK